jgi:hypothetical protein
MAVYVEVQLLDGIHRFCVADREAGLAIVEKLEPHVGRDRYLNRDQPPSMRIATLDGEAVLSLTHIHAARVTDMDVFEEVDRKRREARYAEMRRIDIDLVDRLRP